MMAAPLPMAKAKRFAFVVATAGPLAMVGSPSLAASGVGERVGGYDGGITHLRTADVRLQCNAGWSYDPQKQYCVRAHAPTRAAPRARAPRATTPRVSSQTKRRPPEAAGIRTLCVRQCDGYYFAISYSATRKRFKVDEAVCKAMYGGAAADLYFHDNGSPADTAVSLKGKPLAQEPYAFAFRHTFNETCQAELTGGLARLVAIFMARAGKDSPATVNSEARATGLLPVPAPRLTAGTDPETLANRSGTPTPAAIRSQTEDYALGASNIRKLGPDYYYADPVAITRLRDPPLRLPEFTLIGSALAQEGDEQ